MTTEQLVGASVWEQELYDHLASHETNERELLVEYQQASHDARSAAFSYLVSIIVADERRHHEIFRELAAALRAEAEFRPEGPSIPRLDGWGKDPRLVVELSERLIDHERQDLRQLQRLQKMIRDVEDTTLWSLLVQLMEADTRKHMIILDFVKEHARKEA